MRAFNRSVLIITSSATLLIASCSKNVDTSADTAETVSNEAVANENKDQKFVQNELLVKFKAGTTETVKNKYLKSISASVAEKILTKSMRHFNDQEGVLLLHTPLAVMEAKNKMKGLEIEYAEPNFIYQHEATSNDTYYTNGSLWGMMGGYGSQANAAWTNNHTGSEAVLVGVIDEGAMYNHADLAGQIWTNPYDVADGIDNDGNGYIDDIHGWDFDKNDKTTFDGSEDDHGTHVSGTIGAKGGNGFGVAGVNWKITIITAKFLGRRGGTTANAIKALDYITDLKVRHPLLVLPATNNSWGGGGFSQALGDAIDRANSANILFIAAAGNGGSDGVGDNNNTTPNYPSNYSYPNVIAVAAITSNGALSSFSNYGSTTVHIGAPGSGITSTVPGKNLSSAYASYSGTSMATPHVTGAAALYAASNTGATAAQIKAAILNSSVPTASLSGKCITGGRLNVSGF
ncbi:MAG TPA: S8 family peptidase [Flavitalea sp.]|nr:S8 family peptidase [Flavitalea sp.]